MRTEFVTTLVELAERDERILLLTGDLGYTVVEPFVERFPERFNNVGVAEQNMVGIATGLGEAGFVPFVWSIATFASMRPYEFIRNGPALHELPVRIVGIGGGLDYSHNGVSHYALEDVAIMRVQPGVTVIAPADLEQARSALLASAGVEGPIYFRLGKETAVVPGLDGRFELGRAALIGDGREVAVVAMGGVTKEAVRALELMAEAGVAGTLAVVSSFNPSPVDDLAELLSEVPLAVTVEAHYRVGGVGSLVSEVVAEHGLDCRVVRCGVRDMPRGATGSEQWLYGSNGISGPAVAQAVLHSLDLVGR
jgi:transketolase